MALNIVNLLHSQVSEHRHFFVNFMPYNLTNKYIIFKRNKGQCAHSPARFRKNTVATSHCKVIPLYPLNKNDAVYK